MQKYIDIKGARENNLKNVSLKIPKDKLVVMTGLSGSGKTSLAFDTIYAEGQRRYVESLSAYARQFLGNIDKPDVDSIEGLSPAISIDQRTTSKNPRSTVGTVTEIYDHLRLLYARIGVPHCPRHNIPITAQTIEQMLNKIYEYPVGTRVNIYSPIVFGQKGMHEKTLDLVRREGFGKVRVNGEIVDVDEEIKLDKNKKHSIDIVVDRVRLRDDVRSRLYHSLETALKFGDGKVVVDFDGRELIFSEQFACPYCDFSVSKLEPRLFSFNSPFGACPECKGLGVLQRIDENLLITDPKKSIREGAIRYLRYIVDSDNIEWQLFERMATHYNIDLDKPYEALSEEEKDIIMYGSKEPISYEITTRNNYTFKRTQKIEGIAALIERRYQETRSNMSREYYGSYLRDFDCPVCRGKRLSQAALSVLIGGKNIADFTEM